MEMPSVELRSVLVLHRVANAPRSLSHLPARLRNAEYTHKFLTHPTFTKWMVENNSIFILRKNYRNCRKKSTQLNSSELF